MADFSTGKGLQTYTVQEAQNAHLGKVIRITPTISATAYDAGDVLFLTTEIENAVAVDGGTSKLISISTVHQHDAVDDIALVFMQVSKDLIGALSPGSTGGPAISDANAEAAKILGTVLLDGSENNLDLGVVGVFTYGSTLTALPMLLQAESTSRSVYVGGIAVDAQDYDAVDDLDLVFHIEYK